NASVGHTWSVRVDEFLNVSKLEFVVQRFIAGGRYPQHAGVSSPRRQQLTSTTLLIRTPRSPTYYPASSVINHTHHLPMHVPQSHNALVPSSVPHGAALLDAKHYGSVSSQSGDSHIRVIDSRSGQVHPQEYIIDPHHHTHVQGVAHVPRPPQTYEKQSQYRVAPHHHAHAANVIPNHTKPIPGNVPPHHYMMELGLFMA
ncbi:hypothetical protein Ocin01_03903, partial [Orchesella cincta]